MVPEFHSRRLRESNAGGGPARALLLRDRFDDDPAPGLLVEGLRRDLECLPHERFDLGAVDGRSNLEHDVSNILSLAGENSFRVLQLRALEEEEIHPAGIDGDREDRVRGALGRSKADDERVVVVVNELDGSRKSRAHLQKDRPRERRDLGREPCEEDVELLPWSPLHGTPESLASKGALT